MWFDLFAEKSSNHIETNLCSILRSIKSEKLIFDIGLIVSLTILYTTFYLFKLKYFVLCFKCIALNRMT